MIIKRMRLYQSATRNYVLNKKYALNSKCVLNRAGLGIKGGASPSTSCILRKVLSHAYRLALAFSTWPLTITRWIALVRSIICVHDLGYILCALVDVRVMYAHEPHTPTCNKWPVKPARNYLKVTFFSGF